MTSDHREPAAVADRLRDARGAFEFEPHHCFACGELNEHGLHLALHADPSGSWVELEIPQRFQGWDGVVHGGIVCTILDEVMAWSVIGRGTWGVTARLNVAFRRPIRIGRMVRAEGQVADLGRRAAKTTGRVIDAETGEVLATAEGTFVAVPGAELDRLQRRYGLRRLGPVEEANEATNAIDTTDTEDAPAPVGAAR